MSALGGRDVVTVRFPPHEAGHFLLHLAVVFEALIRDNAGSFAGHLAPTPTPSGTARPVSR